MRSIIMAAIALVLAGCQSPAEFSTSLTEPGENAGDARLLGHWHAEDGGEALNAVIAEGEGPMLRVSLVFQSPEDGWLSTLEAFPSRVEGRALLKPSAHPDGARGRLRASRSGARLHHCPAISADAGFHDGLRAAVGFE